MIEHLSTYQPWLTQGVILSLVFLGVIAGLMFLWSDTHGQ